MTDEIITLTLLIDLGEGISLDLLFNTTQDLRSEIREVGVQSVELERSNTVPTGAMSPDAFTWGALAIAVLPTVVPALIDFFKGWKLRHAGSTITIKHQVGEQIVEATLPSSMSEEQLSKYLDVLKQQLLKDKGKKSK